MTRSLLPNRPGAPWRSGTGRYFTSSHRGQPRCRRGKLPRWWKALYDGSADVVLHGHVHSYERFAELTSGRRGGYRSGHS